MGPASVFAHFAMLSRISVASRCRGSVLPAALIASPGEPVWQAVSNSPRAACSWSTTSGQRLESSFTSNQSSGLEKSSVCGFDSSGDEAVFFEMRSDQAGVTMAF